MWFTPLISNYPIVKKLTRVSECDISLERYRKCSVPHSFWIVLCIIGYELVLYVCEDKAKNIRPLHWVYQFLVPRPHQNIMDPLQRRLDAFT